MLGNTGQTVQCSLTTMCTTTEYQIHTDGKVKTLNFSQCVWTGDARQHVAYMCGCFMHHKATLL